MPKPVWTLLLAAATALVLSGCVESLPNLQVAHGDIRSTLAPGQASARGASVAIASLDGAPSGVAARFNTAFAKEAGSREITVADAGSARYLVRGYLSVAPADGGTAVSYVYDIFDAGDQQRVERVSDVLTAPGSGADAWALVDDRVMASLAGRSADALAAALAAASAAPATTADASPTRSVE